MGALAYRTSGHGQSAIAARVLIVDDSPTETLAISTLLKRHGYQVLAATSGEEGIETARREQPDLVLMDVVMPGISGFQATRQLTREQATGHIPVVIISTKDQPTDRVWGLRQGAREYLCKPVLEQRLLQTIEQILTH